MGYTLEVTGTIYDEEEKKLGFSMRKLKAAMVMAGYKGNASEISRLLHITPQSVFNKQKKGGTFRKDEIELMINTFRISPEKVIEIFFPESFAGQEYFKRKQRHAELIGDPK